MILQQAQIIFTVYVFEKYIFRDKLFYKHNIVRCHAKIGIFFPYNGVL
jgi:hypothetical protein